MIKTTLILLMVLFTSMSFVGALNVETEQQELGSLIVETCNTDLQCIEDYKNIMRIIFNIDPSIENLMTILYLYSI